MGPMVNDSLIVALMEETGIIYLATSDASIQLYKIASCTPSIKNLPKLPDFERYSLTRW